MNWSMEAEQAILGGLMLDGDAMRRVSVSVNDFYNESHRQIFSAMVSLASAKKPIDPVTVMDALGSAISEVGGLAYLSDLTSSVASSSGISRYCEIVKDRAMRRKLIAAADEALAIAQDSNTSIEDAVDKASTLFSGVANGLVSTAPKKLSEVALMRSQFYEDVQFGKVVPGWPSGIPSLDRMLNGGFRPGCLYIVAARPAIGKSSFSQFIGLKLASDDHCVLFLSQEMSNDELADRAVSSVARVNYSSLVSGRMNDDDWSRASEGLEELRKLPFHVEDQGGLTIAQVKSKARQVRGLKVLIVDYLQLMSGDGANRNSEIEVISRGLKAFAKEAGIVIIALSQLNRQVESRPNKKPNMGDLRDSGAIEQDADCVMFLWPIGEESLSKTIGLDVAKNRSGRTGDCCLIFDGSIQRWVESSQRPSDLVQSKKYAGACL